MLTTLRSLLCSGETAKLVAVPVKAGVRLENMDQRVVDALPDIKGVFADTRYEFVVTSARDGEHMEGSLHYEGKALDIRTRHMPEAVQKTVAQKLQDVLGSDWDVVLEDTHLHIELDP